jgi:hypothetical protein
MPTRFGSACARSRSAGGSASRRTAAPRWAVQDNISFSIVDGASQSLSVLIWELFQDTFPANETAGLAGTADFDTTTALIKGGLNTAPLTGWLDRYDVPQDTLQVDVSGDSVEVQSPPHPAGPRQLREVAGDIAVACKVPTDSTRIAPGDGSPGEHIENPARTRTIPATPLQRRGALRHDQR